MITASGIVKTAAVSVPSIESGPGATTATNGVTSKLLARVCRTIGSSPGMVTQVSGALGEDDAVRRRRQDREHHRRRPPANPLGLHRHEPFDGQARASRRQSRAKGEEERPVIDFFLHLSLI